MIKYVKENLYCRQTELQPSHSIVRFNPYSIPFSHAASRKYDESNIELDHP